MNLKRFFMSVVPSAVLVCASAYVLLSDQGLITQKQLKVSLFDTASQAQQVEDTNDSLRAKITRLKTQQKAVLLTASSRLHAAPSGATIYRFGSRTQLD